MPCELDGNIAYNISIYGVGSVLYCIDCIKKRLFICKMCGEFVYKKFALKEDPFDGEYHPNKNHIFIEVTDEQLLIDDEWFNTTDEDEDYKKK